MKRFVICHVDNPDFLISGVGIGCCEAPDAVRWTTDRSFALHLEEEEAEALVKFIGDVIDWELSECLVLKSAG